MGSTLPSPIRTARFLEDFRGSVRWVFGPATLKGGPRDPQPSCRVSLGQPGHAGEPFWIDPASRSPQSDALRPGPCQSGSDSFLDPGPLELGVRPQDVHLQLAGRRGGVDTLGERYERNPEHLHILKQGHEMPQVAAEASRTQGDVPEELRSAGRATP